MRRVRQLPDISIRQLEYLVAVADAPTWAVAAAEIGVSPSALSQGLAELERRVGVDLFEPQGRRRVLRGAASPVLDHARQVVALTGDLLAWSERVRGATTGSVRVGMIDVAAVVHFAGLLARFRSDRPDVDLHLTVAPSRDLLGQLQVGDLDVVVCVEPGALPPGIVATPVFDEPLVVFAPPGSSIGDAAEWGPWVLFPTGSISRGLIEDALRARSVPIVVAAESHQPDVLRRMVDLGLGWTVLPAVQGPGDRNAVVGPELLTRRIVVAHRDAAVADPAVHELRSRLLAT